MEKIKNYLAAIAVLLSLTAGSQAQAQASRSGAIGTDQICALNGMYRVDAASSDRLYSVVKDATSAVPFGEQQQFFIDLSTRLTPPDLLAIECRGNYVTVGSSRANKVTYLADGKNRRERLANGGAVSSKVTLTQRSLTFVSTGSVEDNVNVAFQSLSDGRLSVTRRIYAKQLSAPIIIQTFYDRLSPTVDWTVYDRSLVARDTRTPDPSARTSRAPNATEGNRLQTLRTDFADWLEATNRRDIDRQMDFYLPQLKAYYLSRNTPQRAVRLEKERVFGPASSVDIRAGEPEIVFQEQGRTAVMRFVKEYRVSGRSRTREGAVIQELRWQYTPGGWRIFSERDVRVIR